MEGTRPMRALKIFTLSDETSPYFMLHYTLEVNLDKIPFNKTQGSIQIMAARLLNLSWADYLRFCRDILDANVVGCGKLYPVIYFKKNKETDVFLKILNTRATMALAEIELKKAEGENAHE